MLANETPTTPESPKHEELRVITKLLLEPVRQRVLEDPPILPVEFTIDRYKFPDLTYMPEGKAAQLVKDFRRFATLGNFQEVTMFSEREGKNVGVLGRYRLKALVTHEGIEPLFLSDELLGLRIVDFENMELDMLARQMARYENEQGNRTFPDYVDEIAEYLRDKRFDEAFALKILNLSEVARSIRQNSYEIDFLLTREDEFEKQIDQLTQLVADSKTQLLKFRQINRNVHTLEIDASASLLAQTPVLFQTEVQSGYVTQLIPQKVVYTDPSTGIEQIYGTLIKVLHNNETGVDAYFFTSPKTIIEAIQAFERESDQ